MFTKEPEFYKFNGEESGISSKKLVLAEWFIRHQFLLRKILIGFLIAFIAITLGYGLFGFIKYAAFDYWNDRDQLVEQTRLIQNYEALHSIFGAADLIATNTNIYRSSDGKYDFVSLVRNPNEYWIAKIKFKFVFNGGETDIAEAVVLPGREYPIGYFGFSSNAFPTNARLVIENFEWKSVNLHKIVDVQSFISERSDFTFDNFVFTRGSTNENEVPANRLEFSLFNDSAYSYWDAMFLVELLNGDQTAGYIPLLIDKFDSLEEEKIDLRTFLQTANVTYLRLHPMVNIFDDSIYIEPSV